MPRRPVWISDFVVVGTFAVILAILSVVNIRTLRETYAQNEKLQTVNQFLDCLDPTTRCGMKLAEQQAAEREWLTETMRSQAICTLLTSRAIGRTNGLDVLEQVYNECVEARTKPPPKTQTSPVEVDGEEG